MRDLEFLEETDDLGKTLIEQLLPNFLCYLSKNMPGIGMAGKQDDKCFLSTYSNSGMGCRVPVFLNIVSFS